MDPIYSLQDLVRCDVILFKGHLLGLWYLIVRIMDPKRSAQDVLRCYLCESPNPQYNCDICHTNLCKTCAGEHLLAESKQHKVVPIRQLGYGPDYPNCLQHSKKTV